MNALERFNNQDENNVTMQKPFQTSTDLYVWENWTYDLQGNITDIRYYCEDINGGKTFRVSEEDYIFFTERAI